LPAVAVVELVVQMLLQIMVQTLQEIPMVVVVLEIKQARQVDQHPLIPLMLEIYQVVVAVVVE
jgi:hypothetical protein